MSLKNVALTALVASVVALAVWFGLHYAMHGRGMMHGAGMMQEQGIAQAPAGHGGHGQKVGPMGTVLTGDPDRDFAAEMIPHHQLAVDMANALLKDGKNPELRKLAEEIIAAQTKEIAFLEAWLAKQPK